MNDVVGFASCRQCVNVNRITSLAPLTSAGLVESNRVALQRPAMSTGTHTRLVHIKLPPLKQRCLPQEGLRNMPRAFRGVTTKPIMRGRLAPRTHRRLYGLVCWSEDLLWGDGLPKSFHFWEDRGWSLGVGVKLLVLCFWLWCSIGVELSWVHW